MQLHFRNGVEEISTPTTDIQQPIALLNNLGQDCGGLPRAVHLRLLFPAPRAV